MAQAWRMEEDGEVPFGFIWTSAHERDPIWVYFCALAVHVLNTSSGMKL